MEENKKETFDNLLNITEPKLQPIAIRLREIILELNPNACEVVRLGEKASTFGIGPKKMSEGYTYILPHKNWINLGFFRGALFAEKFKILEGTGKNMRHVKIRSIEDAENPTLIKLLKLALEERQKALTKND